MTRIRRKKQPSQQPHQRQPLGFGTQVRQAAETVFSADLPIVRLDLITVFYDPDCLGVMQAIEANLPPAVRRMEFGVFFDGHLDASKNAVIVEPTYVIPNQAVTCGSFVDKDGVDKPIVAHRHPDGMTVFSRTDSTVINPQHLASLLYTDGRFVRASVAIKTTDLDGEPLVVMVEVGEQNIRPLNRRITIPQDELRKITLAIGYVGGLYGHGRRRWWQETTPTQGPTTRIKVEGKDE